MAQSKDMAQRAESVRVLEGGRILIPARIRKELGIKAGDCLSLELEDGVLRLERRSSEPSGHKRCSRPTSRVLPSLTNSLPSAGPSLPPMVEAVLDASAVLARLQDEPGAEVVDTALERGPCAISAVNLAEVAARLSDRGATPAAIEAGLAAFPLEIIAFDEAAAYASALLRPSNHQAGLSLGDRACIALAETLSVPVITCDPAVDNFRSLCPPSSPARAERDAAGPSPYDSRRSKHRGSPCQTSARPNSPSKASASST